MKYFSEYQGRIYAVTNWKHCNSKSDVMVRVPLKQEEIDTYEQLKEQGKNETEIYNVLFPPYKRKVSGPRKIEIDVKDLTKPQALNMIHATLEVELESLERMTLPDLQELLLAINKLSPE